ncbi:hypothetical protein GCM10009539_06650 [Cryptosporangium japonicum]|uniref:Uncharacterized protein n=2 Tax=Cryptosporangium japonicum TaxID=80872 RepID=A0ABN0TKQ0_9ACTN
MSQQQDTHQENKGRNALIGLIVSIVGVVIAIFAAWRDVYDFRLGSGDPTYRPLLYFGVLMASLGVLFLFFFKPVRNWKYSYGTICFVCTGLVATLGITLIAGSAAQKTIERPVSENAKVPEFTATISDPSRQPRSNQTFTLDGDLAGQMPNGHTLWIIAWLPEDKVFYLQPGPCVVVSRGGWTCGGIHTRAAGEWDFILVVADSRRTSELVEALTLGQKFDDRKYPGEDPREFDSFRGWATEKNRKSFLVA